MNIWEKIKAFFQKKAVQIVEICVIVVCVVGLVIGGIQVEGIKSILDYVSAGILAIVALYKIIVKVINKEE